MNILKILFYLIAPLALFIRLSSQSQNSTQAPKAVDKLFIECKEQTGATQEDYELIKNRKMPQSETGICMVECLLTKFHIIENHNFNDKSFVLIFSTLAKGNLIKIRKLKQLASICSKEVSNNRSSGKKCETSKLLLECFGQHSDLFVEP